MIASLFSSCYSFETLDSTSKVSVSYWPFGKRVAFAYGGTNIWLRRYGPASRKRS